MKKYVESRKIRKIPCTKSSSKYKIENANKVKRDPKLNVDDRQDAMKH